MAVPASFAFAAEELAAGRLAENAAAAEAAAKGQVAVELPAAVWAAGAWPVELSPSPDYSGVVAAGGRGLAAAVADGSRLVAVGGAAVAGLNFSQVMQLLEWEAGEAAAGRDGGGLLELVFALPAAAVEAAELAGGMEAGGDELADAEAVKRLTAAMSPVRCPALQQFGAISLWTAGLHLRGRLIIKLLSHACGLDRTGRWRGAGLLRGPVPDLLGLHGLRGTSPGTQSQHTGSCKTPRVVC